MIDATENVTCTFTYETSSTITVLVDSRPGSSQFFNYTFNAPGQSPVNFSLTDGFNAKLASRRFTVAPGTGYSVSQAAAPGWDLTSITCDDGSSPTNIDVGANENIICTFVNDKLGAINVTLDAQPEASQQFSFTAGGGLSPSAFTLSEPTANSESSFREFENVSPAPIRSPRPRPPAGRPRSSPAREARTPPRSASPTTRPSTAPSRTSSRAAGT